MRKMMTSVWVAAAAAACGTSGLDNGSGGAAASSAAIDSTGAAQADGATSRPFEIADVASFTTPWALDFLPDGRALVTEKEGKLWLVDTASGQRQSVSGVPQVRVAGQGGLGDVKVHPDFARNGRIYLSFVEEGPDGTSGAAVGYGRLAGDGSARIADFRTVWRQTPKVAGDGHFSHRILFAPDGAMLVSSGDRQKMEPAQDMGSDLGKIIRLTPEGGAAPGNPWSDKGGRQASYWSIGHRNMLGMAFGEGGRLWAIEMGPKGGDEINLVRPGANYGWPQASYGDHYDGEDIPDDHASRGFVEPKAHWTPVISPGGMIIHSGKAFEQWRGDALVAGLSAKALVLVDLDGDSAREAQRWDMGQRIRAVAEAPDGTVYLLEDGRNGPGKMLRLVPAGRR